MAFINPPNLRAVKAATNTPPGTPATNDIYITLDTPTGDWTGQAYKFAIYNGTSWDFITPSVSSLVWSLSDNTIYIYNSSNQWAAPSSGGSSGGSVGRIPYWNTTSTFATSLLKQVSSKIGVISGSESPEGFFQLYKSPSDFGTYSFSNWNGSGQAVTLVAGTPTNNGGSTPASFFPALVLNREGVTGTAYANYVEFKVGRWEHPGGNSARSGMTIAMTHGAGDGSGTDVAGFFSDKRVETYGTVLRLNATTASSTSVNIQVSNATNRPALRWNGGTSKWQFSNDGTTFTDIAGTSGSSAPFADNIDLVQNATDGTKRIRFSAASITTSTTRTITIPDANTTMAGIDIAQTFTNKTITNSSNVLGGVTMTLGSDGTGDVYYRNASGILTRLGIGSSGQVLTVSGGLPSWQTSGAGSSNPFSDATAIVKNDTDNTKLLRLSAANISTGTTRTFDVPDANTTLLGTDTTQTISNKTLGSGTKVSIGSDATGDIWYRDSSGNFTRLGIGSSGQILTVSGGLPSWQTSGAGSSPPFSDASAIIKNDTDNTKLLIISAASIATGTTRTLTAPNANTTIVGTDVSQTLTNKTITNSNNVLGGVTMTLGSDATGDIYYRNSSGVLTRLPIGSTGQVLTVASGLPSWATGGGGGGVTGSGTTNQYAIWTSSSAIGASSILRSANSRLGINVGADPTTNDGRLQINPFPDSGGGTINYGNWNSTGNPVIAINAESAANNGGSSMVSPFPVIVLGLSGVPFQTFATTAALAINRYSTSGNQSNGRLVIQVNNGSNDYPTNTMCFYGTGRAGIGNGSLTTSGNDAKALFHVGDQLINAGSSYSTVAWNGGGLVPLLSVWDANDAASTTLHPSLVLGKKGVSAGQEAQRVEFGIGRWESSSNAPRTRLDIRLAHATNETVPFRVATFMSYGGFGVGQSNTTSSTTESPEAVLQVGNKPSSFGSYSISNWNSSGNRIRGLFVTPTNNGGGTPAAAEPAIVLARDGVFAGSFDNYVEFKISRYENSSTNARSALTIAATHGAGDATGTDIIEFRSDKSSNFKGQFGGPRNTQTGNGSQTVDWSLGNTFEHTLNGATTTFTFNNAKAGFEYTILLIQDATGSRTVTWPASVKWSGNTAPTLTTTANKIDLFKFYYNGTNFIHILSNFNI